jgi:hypothetical protein
LAFQQAICVSAATTLPITSRRAVCSRLRAWVVATSRNAVLYCLITFVAQNCAMSVCSGVRGLPVARPQSLISLYSSTHRWLSSAGGGSGRTWSALGITNGRVSFSHGVWGGRNAGGVGSQKASPAEAGGV